MTAPSPRRCGTTGRSCDNHRPPCRWYGGLAILYPDFFFQDRAGFFHHGQIIENDTQRVRGVGTVYEGGVCLAAPLAGLEIPGARAVEEHRMTIEVGTQGGAFDAVIGDALLIRVLSGCEDSRGQPAFRLPAYFESQMK